MFDRLNQPISLRRKPTAQDAVEAADAAPPAPTAAGAAESQGRERSSLFARLNQPISLGHRSKRTEPDPAAAAPAPPPPPALATRSAPAEPIVLTSEPVAKPEPVAAASAERVVSTSQPEPVAERVVSTSQPEPVADGVVSTSQPEPVADGVTSTPDPDPDPEPVIVATEGVPTVAAADEPALPTSRVHAPHLRPAPPAPARGATGPGLEESAPASVAAATPDSGSSTPTGARVPARAAAEPEEPREAGATDPALTVATDPRSSRPSRLGRVNRPISLARKSRSAAAPAAAAPAAAKRGSRLARLNQPISLGRKRTASELPAAPVAAAPSAVAAAPAKRGSRLGRLNQPLSIGRKSRDAALPAGTPAAGRRRAAHAPHRPRRTRSLVGLEIEPGQLVAARSHVNGQLVVERAVGAPLAPNIVRDGEVTDVAALSAALTDLFDGSGLDRRVRIGIANQRIVMRQLELPPILDPRELANAVHFSAQDEIPMPIESVVLDYHALGVVETDAGPRMRVLVVAARRDMVERVLLAARQAGLRPEGVDLAAFGMIRALRPMDLPETDQVLYLSIGGLTNLAIASGSTCEFTRVITTGIDTIVAEVASRAGIPYPEARLLVASISPSIVGPRPLPVPSPEPVLPARTESPDGPAADRAEMARTALGDGIRRIAAEVRNSLDFHLGAHRDAPIARTVLTGPALDLDGFDAALGRELGMPLTRGEVALASPSAAGHVPMSRLAVAAGLSVAEGPK